ncbi:MAG TPA: NUDIX domain-containing protein [Candidatus Saccharimonadales bacterium]|jgi:8-oxo-dGTP diphosphatase|nr:NUDIX domain-containing protein [Candidatus Saccharimonadales bacterium]
MTEYTSPPVTVDGVVLQLQDGKLSVLLINRANDPLKGHWAVPGGYCSREETTASALHRVLLAKAGLNTDGLGVVEQLYTFDTPAYSQTGNAVSVVYMGLGRALAPTGETAEDPRFFPVDDLPDLAFEHARIVASAHERLRGKVTYTNAVFSLIPELFTLTQLQSAYEAILGHALDKRNFRKKFLTLDLIESTDEHYIEGAHRPARLFRFKTQTLQTLSRSFE